MSIAPWKTSRFGIKEVQFVQENYFYTYSHLLFVTIVYLNCMLEIGIRVYVKYPVTEVHTDYSNTHLNVVVEEV